MLDVFAFIPSSIWASLNSWFTPTVLFLLLNLMIGTIFFRSTFSNQEKHHQNQENKEHESHQHQPPKLARSPSALQRLKSINFYNFRSQEFPPITSFFKQTPGSNPSQQFHQEQQQPVVETQTRYIFEEPHLHEDPDSYTHFKFENTREEKIIDTETHYTPDEISAEIDEDADPQSLDEVYSQLAQLTDSPFSRTKSDQKPASGEVPARLPGKMLKSASVKSVFGHFEESDIVENYRPATVRERKIPKATEGDDEVDAKADDFINKFKQQLKLQRLDSILRYKDVISRGSAK